MRLIFLLFLFCSSLSAQVPGFVQHTACPNSGVRGAGTGSTTHYNCYLPDPALSGNVLTVSIFLDNTGTPTKTVSDDKGDTFTLRASVTSSNGNFAGIYTGTATAGARKIILTVTSGTFGAIGMSILESNNTGALDVATCRNQTTNSTSITAGSQTPTVTGDLVYQTSFSDNVTPIASYTVGSQSNITWALASAMNRDGEASQWGVYNSISALNATFTQGTSNVYDSCVIFLKAASAGTAPSAAIRIPHMEHVQMPTSHANPYVMQFPATSNFIVISFTGGGNTISSITSSNPSCTWNSSGTAAVNITSSQLYYSSGCSPTTSMSISITMSATTADGTFMLHDMSGTLSFDADSAGQTGNTGSTHFDPLSTCSSCLTPSTANGIVFANMGQDVCTVTSISLPSGGLIDSAFYDGNSLDGPQTVDQNNGWQHYYNPNTSAISASWGETCTVITNPEGHWAGRVVSFKPPNGPPANQFPRVVGAR